MSPNDIPEDPVLAALRGLSTIDVSPARTRCLRARCHRGLEKHDSSRHLSSSDGAGVRVVRVLASAWCVAYLVETVRQAAAVYGF
jgi:hypothetical protein